MEHARNYHCSIRELSGSGRLFLYPSQPEMTRKEKGMDGKHRHWQTENYRAKLANASCRTARSGRKRFRKKSSSLRSGIFPEKPCLSGSICRWALVSSTGCQARYSQLKIKEYATSDHHKTVTSSDRDARDKKTKVHVPQPAIKLPPRGTTGPVHISKLLNPVLEICRHPDRNRLLAELFSEY